MAAGGNDGFPREIRELPRSSYSMLGRDNEGAMLECDTKVITIIAHYSPAHVEWFRGRCLPGHQFRPEDEGPRPGAIRKHSRDRLQNRNILFDCSR